MLTRGDASDVGLTISCAHPSCSYDKGHTQAMHIVSGPAALLVLCTIHVSFVAVPGTAYQAPQRSDVESGRVHSVPHSAVLPVWCAASRESGSSRGKVGVGTWVSKLGSVTINRVPSSDGASPEYAGLITFQVQ